MADLKEALDASDNVFPSNGRTMNLKGALLEICDELDGTEELDGYCQSEALGAFETEIAEMFGKEAAVFMPSGTMAQNTALRMWCERRSNYTVAMHPTAHPEFAEHAGYLFLHNIRRLQFGVPESVGDRLLKVKDFEGLGQEPGVVLLELPNRPLGGQLRPWDDLVAIREWTQQRGIPLHLDGARIWQCRPFYQKSYAEIAALFDSVYVSFYKDIGALGGSMLLGSAPFIQEARIWQRRHGGNLFTQGPFWASAMIGVRKVLPQIDDWVGIAREAASILSEFDPISIVPNTPHVNMFRMYVRGNREALVDRHNELATKMGTLVFKGLRPTVVPDTHVTEMHIWRNATDFDMSRLRPFLEELFK